MINRWRSDSKKDAQFSYNELYKRKIAVIDMIKLLVEKILESLKVYEDFRIWFSKLDDQDQLNLIKRLTRVIKTELQRLLEG